MFENVFVIDELEAPAYVRNILVVDNLFKDISYCEDMIAHANNEPKRWAGNKIPLETADTWMYEVNQLRDMMPHIYEFYKSILPYDTLKDALPKEYDIEVGALTKYTSEEHVTFKAAGLLTVALFLNDVDGGESEFYFEDCLARISAKRGRIVVYPASWNYIYKSMPISGEPKYMVECFIKHK